MIKNIKILLLILTFFDLSCAEESEEEKQDATVVENQEEGAEYFSATEFFSSINAYRRQNTPEKILLVFSGNASCKRPGGLFSSKSPTATSFFNSIATSIANWEVKPLVISTCFDLSHDIYFQHYLEGSKVYRIRLQEFFPMLEAITHKDDDLTILGHSYGGWLAMDFSQKYGKTRRIKTLVTVDPVSPLDCNYGAWKGCKNSSGSFSGVSNPAVRSSVGNWFNFYQTSGPIIHSTKIGEADRNTLFPNSNHSSIYHSPIFMSEMATILQNF